MKNWLFRDINKIKSGWYLWLFPLFAVLISAYLFKDFYEQRGTVIRIAFKDAAGIQAQKTQVRFRGVKIGLVEKVLISEDQKKVIAEVRLHKDAESFAVKGSKFSLILPKVNFEGISGLETLFEGTYIAALPGPKNAVASTDFDAQTAIASAEHLEETTPYYLETSNAESIDSGDIVTFRGMKIGTVTKLGLTKDSQMVRIQINIEHRYNRLIRTNTVFWKKPGIYAKLGLFNSEVIVNSAETILRGGINLSTPDPAGPMAKAWTRFYLEQKPPEEAQNWNPPLAFDR